MKALDPIRFAALVLIATSWAAPALSQPPPQGLPPVPVPPENPITEGKRVLGKILFWEEQLSSDDTIACGTCHRPGQAGADPRAGLHPGPDGLFGTPDDIAGSLGVVARDANGDPIEDPLFGFAPQVTSRTAPSFFTSQFAPQVFWDGRAGNVFLDPEDGSPVIAVGGALENQAIGPILNSVEMAHADRDWSDVRTKLENSAPLALATNLPPDVADAIAVSGTYPELFAAAFGDPGISASRIAMAIATYERTLVADQTPFDLGTLTPQQAQGLNVFVASNCAVCHQPPFFTNHTFRNLGVRPVPEDRGRQDVTGVFADRGRFKVPSLRNVALKPSFMHNGARQQLNEVVQFYADVAQQFPDNKDPLLPVPVPPPAVPQLLAFLTGGLTDPRVAAETFPFDRPTLRSELGGTTSAPVVAANFLSLHPAFPNPFTPQTTLSYTLASPSRVSVTIFDAQGRLVRRLNEGNESSGRHQWPWDGLDDQGLPVNSGVYFYRVSTGAEQETGKVIRIR